MAKNLYLTTKTPDVVTEILIEEGMLRRSKWLELLKKVSNRFVIVTDECVLAIWGNALATMLRNAGFEILLLAVPQGEKSKSHASKEALEEQIGKARWGRDTGMIALGGGMITDLAGFVAATYCRGIPLISIPTTLLGMVDASLGGKVGINTAWGKNMIGTFHHPRYIFIDLETLNSLPFSEYLNGLSEVIKYALIASSDLFEQLFAKKPLARISHKFSKKISALLPEINRQDSEDSVHATRPRYSDDEDRVTECASFSRMCEKSGLEAIREESIQRCCAIKMDVVSQDPQEKGLRRILNFGHTVGHAIETASEYSISHGAAIAIGMIAESYLSAQLGYLSTSSVEKIEALFNSYGFPLQLDTMITEEKCMDIMRRDKKASASQPRCVLLSSIGKVVPFEETYCCEVSDQQWQDTLSWMFSKFRRP